MPATVEIDVQLEPEHRVVHADSPGCHDERLPAGAPAAIDESLAARHPEGTAVRVDGRSYRPAIVEIRCSGCSYGGVVARLPPRCPMCGATAWRVTERLRPPTA